MSERASFRGRGSSRAGGGGDTHRGGRGGVGGPGGTARGGSGGTGHGGQQAEKPKKENILDLTKYMDKEITVKFNGGREGTALFTRLLFALLFPVPRGLAFWFCMLRRCGMTGHARPLDMRFGLTD